ncbi:hypothetical protein XbrCFBP1976_16795 [Xanthomonas bromi]|uniref:Uncharacterized protein n=1 Tax=Xanthomonas bromi TaxID=56449 RepID=A0ABX5BNE4_9XANT|nr:hypothetical protein XbrCFBP1976_16795 [Xanthomonas bromi]
MSRWVPWRAGAESAIAMATASINEANTGRSATSALASYADTFCPALYCRVGDGRKAVSVDRWAAPKQSRRSKLAMLPAGCEIYQGDPLGHCFIDCSHRND